MGRNKIEKHLKKNPLKVHIEQFRIDKLGGEAKAKRFVIYHINKKTDGK